MKPGWFGPKKTGFGIAPKRWQGWAVAIGSTGLLILFDRLFSRHVQAATGLPGPLINAGFALVWLLLLLAVAALTWEDDRDERDRK